MYERKFSSWKKWENRNEIPKIDFPGVYVISHTEKNIENRKFSWRKEIIYIGMTNACKGLKGRLKQFDNTIIGKRGHGGADRVRYKYQDYKKLIKHLYVAVASFNADVTSNQPKDLNVMGDVAKFEYQCFANFVETYGRLPEFNNKTEAPKYSLTYGRK